VSAFSWCRRKHAAVATIRHGRTYARNLPQEAPRAFADAVAEVDGY
jgi:hypothetical protein